METIVQNQKCSASTVSVVTSEVPKATRFRLLIHGKTRSISCITRLGTLGRLLLFPTRNQGHWKTSYSSLSLPLLYGCFIQQLHHQMFWQQCGNFAANCCLQLFHRCEGQIRQKRKDTVPLPKSCVHGQNLFTCWVGATLARQDHF